MTTPTNWPSPERPGVPLFPERDGLHAIRTPLGTEFLVRWDSAGARLINLSGSPVPVERHPKLSYIGPVLTPTQIAEMLAGERERCARICNDIGAQASLHISELSNRTHGALLAQPEKGRMDAAYECAGRIRNLGATP